MLETFRLLIASVSRIFSASTWPDSIFDLSPEQSVALSLLGIAIGAAIVEVLMAATGYLVLLVWVAGDARARGMDGSFFWMAFVACTLFGGLLIYLMVRPAGNVVPCSTCENKRLEVSALCPHCAHA